MANFRVVNSILNFSTRSELDFVDVSNSVREAVVKSGVRNGVVHVFAPHATGILILTENDEDLLNDVRAFLEKLVPMRSDYNHPSNAHAHLRSMLLPPDKTIPIVNGQVGFGTWQSLLFVETDVYPRKRVITIQVIGES